MTKKRKTYMEIIFAVLLTVTLAFCLSACGTGPTGEKGEPGQSGIGIESIIKSQSVDNVDTYIITFTDGSTTDFAVTNGEKGDDGISIVNAEINKTGELVLSFSDGNSINLGYIMGGAQGEKGISITKAETNEKGELILSFSEGDPVNIGKIVGEKGDKGDDGISITQAIIDDKGELVLTYSDNSYLNLGKIVGEKGDKGDDGVSIVKIEKTDTTNLIDTYTIFLSNGTTTTFKVTNGKDGTDINISNDGFWIINGNKTNISANGLKGQDGSTPYIGENGNWWIGKSDTGVAASATAENNAQELDFYPLDDGTYGVAIGKASYLSKIVIPEFYKGKAVTTIVDEGFKNNIRVKTLVLPSSIAFIQRNAFANSTMNIEWTSPTIEKIDSYSFANYNASRLTIPESVKTISPFAFENCSSVINWDMPQIETLVSNSFGNYKGTQLTIPNSVNEIQEGALFGCSELKKLHLTFVGQKAVTSSELNQYPIGYIFGETSYAGSIVTSQRYHEDSISSLVSKDFYIPKKLRYVSVNCDEILDGAFYNCSYLNQIKIGENVTAINGSAFQNCYKLVEVFNLSSLEIEKGASTFGKIAYNAINVKKQEINGLTTVDGFTYVLSEEGYTLLEVDSSIVDIVVPSVFNNKACDMHPYVFFGNKNMISLTLPTIDCYLAYYFGETYRNASNIIPTTLKTIKVLTATKIPENCFYGCINVTTIEVPDSVTTIGAYAFYNCSKLSTFTFPSNLETAGDYSFSLCSALKEVSFNTKFRGYGKYMFSECTALTTIPTLYGTEIPDNMFYKCTKLNNIKIYTTYIRYSAFSGCTSLTSITLSGTKQIGGSAFRDCTKLSSITLPSSILSIKSGAFSGCTALKTVTFPTSINTMCVGGFSGSFPTDGSTVNSMWYDSVSTTNASTNATNLTSTYASKEWKKWNNGLGYEV